MLLQALAFYVFAAVTVASAAMVVVSRNPVYSVLFLILAFFNAAALFVLIGAEFIAMILVIVYVGAVAVLFLFVVMMLDINLTEIREGFLKYLPVGAAIGVVLLAEILLGLGVLGGGSVTIAGLDKAGPQVLAVDNTRAIGRVLYTQYFYLFQVAGIVLLVAMIGAIVLTLRHKAGVKRQNIADQVARTKATAMEVKTTRSHTGYRVTIHGEDQLLPPDGGQLYLHFVRLESVHGGQLRLATVVDELLDAGVSAEQLFRALTASGIAAVDLPATDKTTFDVIERMTLPVDEQTPRIVPASFTGGRSPSGVMDIAYVIELSQVADRALSSDDYKTVTATVAKEPHA